MQNDFVKTVDFCVFPILMAFRYDFYHNLPIEKGRWNGCDKADRKCTRCINHELGDEKHYLFFCNDPDIVKMRSNFIKENNLKGIQRRNAVSCMETMLSCKQGILTSVGKFLQGIIEVLKDK